jgi:hypothetical protein
LQAVHRQHNTAADAAGLSPRGCGCRAACAQLPDGPGASTSRVADRGWCFGTVAWFKSLCVWAAPMRAGLGSPHWHWPGGGGGAATVASLPGVGGASYDGCLQWRPCHCGVGCVCVATPWLVREPRGWGFRGCGGGGWGAGVWWAGSRAQARGQLATVRHAHRVSTQLKPTQQASGLFLASVARKPSPALTQPSAGRWRLQATCATRCK